MINYDYIEKEIIEQHNSNWPRIPDHPYKILILGAQDLEKGMYYLIWKKNKMVIIKVLLIKFICILKI